MEEFLLGVLFWLGIGTVLALLFSVIALVRSRRPAQIVERVESLEKRLRVLWNEVAELHRLRELAPPREQPVTVPFPTPTSVATAQPAAPGWLAAPAPLPPASATEVIATVVEPEPRPVVPAMRRWVTSPFPAVQVPPHRPKPTAPHEPEDDGWEAVIGASWLNKIGVLVLVVGIALFIGYSLTKLGPTGRLAVGFAASSCLLALGIALEQRPLYRVFARGLAAGGWAGLYFTTYAMHALTAARVIDDPAFALVLLLGVAGGMIGHSLYFRTEAVTALAYFCGYVAIAISPISLFSALACIILTGTLLVVAYRFSWDLLAVMGALCTYGTLALRYTTALDGERLWLNFTSGHAVVALAWLLFEAFDIAVVARGKQEAGVGRTLLPLNVCGWLGLSILQWGPRLDTLYVLLGATAAAYLVSTLVRAFVRPVATFDKESHPLTRAFQGGYEAAITVTAALAALAIWQKYASSTWQLQVALLLEAEFLFLAGILLAQSYLRALASAVFAVALGRLIAYDLPLDGVIRVSGLDYMRWTPLALLVAAVFYVNRALFRPAPEKELLVLEQGYSYVATALVVLVLGCECLFRHSHLRPEYLGAAWLTLSLVLLEVAFRRRLVEFFIQSCVVGLLAIASLVVVNGLLAYPDPPPANRPWVWIWLAPAALALYGASARMFRATPFGSQPELIAKTAVTASVAATGLATLLLWHALPAPLVAVAWGLFALLLVQLGFSLPLPALRWQGYAVTGMAVVRLFFANFTNPGITGEFSHRLLTVGPLILLCYYLAGRLSPKATPELPAAERSLGRFYLYAATLVAVVLLRFELGRVLAVLGWAGLGLGLLYLGLQRKNADLRWQSYLIALLTFARSWATNFYVPEGFHGVFGPVVAGSLVIVSLYVSQLLSPRTVGLAHVGDTSRRPLEWFDANARAFFCTLATTLLAILLFYEVPGKLLTAAWGLEGAALLLAGFALRDHVLRIAGLIVLGICLPKLFFYDLRNLETGYRIFSFVLLGLLLIAVSWVYTRFKPQLRAYL
jgi:uncharacterized membrane protein